MAEKLFRLTSRKKLTNEEKITIGLLMEMVWTRLIRLIGGVEVESHSSGDF
jgi:hypothetical protein